MQHPVSWLPAALAWALTWALAGCAGTPQGLPRYLAPAPGEANARLLLRAALQTGDRLQVLRLADAQACRDPQLLAEAQAPQPLAPLRIGAEALHTLEFQVRRGEAVNPGCSGVMSFTPRNGRSYLMGVALSGNTCSLTLLDVTQPDRPQPVPDFVARGNQHSQCVSLATAQAARAQAPSIQGGQDARGEPVLNPFATARELRGLIQP